MNMSFAITTETMRNFAKTVTRRYGWKNIRQAQILWAVEKGMGLKKGEKIQRIHEIQVLHNRWEPLDRMIKDPAYGEAEVILEGFPHMKPSEFVEMLCDHNKKLPHEEVNRIEFRFLLRDHIVDFEGVKWIIPEFLMYYDGTTGGRHSSSLDILNNYIEQTFRFCLAPVSGTWYEVK